MNKLFLLLSLLRFILLHPKVSILGFSRHHPLPKSYSQNGQDVVLAVLYLLMTKDPNLTYGFLDIGSNHPVKFSNSYLLESLFGLQTVAVDPLLELKGLWESLRPDSIFCNFALGRRFCDLTIRVTSDNMHSSSDISSRFSHMSYSERTVPQVKSQYLLDKYSGITFLFASIDVEGAELEVLKGFDFVLSPIPVICVENNHADLFGSEDIRSFLIENGYIYVARIACLDDLFIHTSSMGSIFPAQFKTQWFSL